MEVLHGWHLIGHFFEAFRFDDDCILTTHGRQRSKVKFNVEYQRRPLLTACPSIPYFSSWT